jgi:hypothetical protein
MQHPIPEIYVHACLAVFAAIAMGQAVGLLWPIPSDKEIKGEQR